MPDSSAADSSTPVSPIATSQAEHSGEIGLRIPCFTCGEILTKPGWLLFGPPNPSGLSMKYHLCRACVVMPSYGGNVAHVGVRSGRDDVLPTGGATTERCPACEGSGWWAPEGCRSVPDSYDRCPTCDGTGVLPTGGAEVTRLREALVAARAALVEWVNIETGAGYEQSPESKAELAAIDAALAQGSDVLPNQGEEPMDTRTEDLSLTDLIDELKQRRPHGRTAGDVLLLTDAVLALAEKLEEALVSRG